MEDAVEDRPHEVLVVHAVEFHQDVTGSRDEVAFHDLGDLLQGIDGLREQLRIAQRDAHVRADIESHHLGIDDQTASEDHAGLIELADTLVNGGSRNTAFARDLQKGHSRILDQILEDFPIDRVQYCFCHIASVLFT